MGATDFWDNQDQANKVVAEFKLVKAQTEPLRVVMEDFENAKLAYEMSREEGDPDLLGEADEQLHELLRSLEKDDLRIVGMSVADSIDYAVTRLIMDDYERAVEIMEQSPFKTFETDIIGVELPASDQPFLEICTALLRGEVNLQYAYPLLYHKGGRKAIAVYVDDIDQGIQILQDRDITLLTEGDLEEDGEFF